MERAVSGSAVGYALAAAICMALASALQHQAATGEQGYRSGIHLLWRLAHRPRWAAGQTVGVAGLALRAAALHAEALAVVQPLLVMGLAFALPLRALLDRARPSAGQVLAAAVLAAGVAIFVAVAHPTAGQPAPDAGAAATVIAAGAILAGACSILAARARSGRLAGFALGLAAGILSGWSAACSRPPFMLRYTIQLPPSLPGRFGRLSCWAPGRLWSTSALTRTRRSPCRCPP